MAKGFLTMFDDPVVGPQVALGLLSTGLGLLTSPPNQVNRAIQGGLGQVGQGLLYGGRQKRREQLAQEKLDRQAAMFAEFARMSGGRQPVEAQGVAGQQPRPYIPGTGMAPWAPGTPEPPVDPAESAQPGGLTLNQYIELMARFPESQSFLGPLAAKAAEPKKLTKTQELIELAGLKPGDEGAKQFALRELGEAPTISQTALEQFNKARLALIERGQNMSAANASRTAAAIGAGLGSIASGVSGEQNMAYLKSVSEAIGKREADDFVRSINPTAQAASVSLEEVAKARDAIKSGAYQGPGADIRLKASQFVKAFTGPGDFDRASATEALEQALDLMGLSQVKPLVGSTAVSNVDLKAVMKAMGEIGTDPTALSKVLDRTEEISKRAIEKNNKVVEKFGKIQGGDQLQMEQYRVSPLPYASMTSPEAVKAAVQNGAITKETAADILRQRFGFE